MHRSPNQPPPGAPTGIWSLMRHMWARNFKANPLGTVAGSIFTVGAVAFMLFFGFFVVLALVVMGGLIVLSQALFRPTRKAPPWSQGRPQQGVDKEAINNNALEGEYEVVSDKKNDASR